MGNEVKVSHTVCGEWTELEGALLKARKLSQKASDSRPYKKVHSLFGIVFVCRRMEAESGVDSNFQN